MQAEQTEAELRAALEIPPDAKHVLIFGRVLLRQLPRYAISS